MKEQKELYNLPEGWVWTTIGEIAILSSGGTPDRGSLSYFNGDIPWVKSGELNHNIITDTEEKITNLALENSSAKMVPSGTLLVALYGSTVGKLAFLGVDGATNQAIASIITTESFEKRYLYYYLLNNREKLLQKRVGGAQPNISQRILIEYPLPLCTSTQQKKLVSKIDSLFSELEHAEKNIQHTKKQLVIYRQVLLKSAFEGGLTKHWRNDNQFLNANLELADIKRKRKSKQKTESRDPQKKTTRSTHNFTFVKNPSIPTWANANLDNLIGINARIGWRGLTKKEYTKEGPLFLSVHSLNYGKNVVLKDANHITLERYEESPEIKLKTDDILLCKDGAGIGKVGIIKNLAEKATVNSSLLVIDSKEVFNPDFLYYFFLGPTMQELVNEKISGSAIPHLFQKDIKKFILKVPPRLEQEQIVEILESRFTLIENLEKSINQILSDILIIRHSILKKAFEGKLVDQDNTDETVGELLEKVKMEKEAYIKSERELEKLKPKKMIQMEIKKTILEILEEAKDPISTQELWTNSVHEGDIEGFYNEIKVIYSKLNDVKDGTRSLLSLKK